MVTYNNALLKSISHQVGVTDEVTECSCCGKQNLKRTVVFKCKDEPGADDFVFLGTTCAQNAKQFKGASKSTIKKEKFQVLRVTKTNANNKVFAVEWHPLDFNFYHVLPNGEKIFRKPDAIKILLSQGNWEGDTEGMLKVVEEEQQI